MMLRVKAMTRKIVPVLCSVILCHACTLDRPPEKPGVKCANEGELLVWQEDKGVKPENIAELSESERNWLKWGYCIEEYSVCFQNEEDGQKYCRKNECNEGLVLCKGKCIAIKDKMHCGLRGGTCDSDDPASANYRGKECPNNSTCNGESCICDEGYISSGDNRCILDIKTQKCGGNNLDCIKEYPNFDTRYIKCENDKCILEEPAECLQNYHRYDENGASCEANSRDNCGSHGALCATSVMVNSKGNARGVASVDNCETGVCKVTGCKAGFFLQDGKCEETDDNNCGELSKTCSTDDVENSIEVRCNINAGHCVAAKCAEGYHVYPDEGTCEEDDENNCGEHGKPCTTEDIKDSLEVACIDGMCTAVRCGNVNAETECSDSQASKIACNGHRCVSVLCKPGEIEKANDGLYAHVNYIPGGYYKSTDDLVTSKWKDTEDHWRCFLPSDDKCGTTSNSLSKCSANSFDKCISLGCESHERYCNKDAVEDTCLMYYRCLNSTPFAYFCD